MKVPLPIASPEDVERARAMVWWGRVPVYSRCNEIVRVDALVASQAEVSERNVDRLASVLGDEEAASWPGPIEVAQLGDRFVIVDGHHRATALVRMGERTIFANIRSAVPTGGTE